MLEKCRSKLAWGLLPSKIEYDEGNRKDALKNYRYMAKENILALNNTCLDNGTCQALPTYRVIPDFDPTTDETHKGQFYNRVRYQIIAHAILGRFDQTSINKLTTQKKYSTW